MSFVLASGLQKWLSNWAALAEWAVAIGTLALAISTWFLSRQAKREATAVRDQVALAQGQLDAELRQLEASQRPFVLPTTSGWRPENYSPVEPPFGRTMGSTMEPWMVLSNAGAGPAYNIRGAVFFPGGIGGGWRMIPTAIPAGQELPVLLEVHAGYEPDWANASGYLRYTDLAGTEWLTHFCFRRANTEQWSVEVTGVGKVETLGEPEYTLEDGWVNRPGEEVA